VRARLAVAREGAYDQYSILRFLLHLVTPEHREYWRRVSEGVLGGSDPRDRSSCGARATRLRVRECLTAPERGVRNREYAAAVARRLSVAWLSGSYELISLSCAGMEEVPKGRWWFYDLLVEFLDHARIKGELGAEIEFTDLDEDGCALVRDALRCRHALTSVELVEAEATP
jgi:hypothetical protein